MTSNFLTTPPLLLLLLFLLVRHRLLFLVLCSNRLPNTYFIYFLVFTP